jgi:glycosyltransferase involved in cell wall biosynthesis
MEVAYLASEYPAISHTFIKREVAALRDRGAIVHTFSVRASPSAMLTPEMVEEAGRTFAILGQPLIRIAEAHAKSFFTSPAAYLKTALLAVHHRAPGVKGLLLGIAHFGEAVVLARELRRRSVGHLHTHFANAGATVGLLAAKMLDISWSFVMHGPSETDYPAGYLLGRKVEAADMVVCVSWFAHSQSMRLVGASHWHKFRLVRCGLEMDKLPTVNPEARDPNTIICVGRLCSDKAQAGLLIAFSRLKQRHPKARLRLVGDGPDRAELESLAQSLGIAAETVFLGRLPENETLKEISKAGIFVLPSFWEGLPVAIMEAMALGIPVVTSRIAGVPELVLDGENGLLFAPANWEELARQLERLLKEPALGKRLARVARESVRKQHDVAESARLLEGYFREMMKG